MEDRKFYRYSCREPKIFDTNSLLQEYRMERAARILMGMDAEELPNDELYFNKVQGILTGAPFIGVPPEPTLVYPSVYLGSQANAENMALLKRLRITHVLNCAGLPSSLHHIRAKRYKGTKIKYQELPIEDEEKFHIARFFSQAHLFINSGQAMGMVLVYCPGVSRSGAVIISYLMRHGAEHLLRAVKTVKHARRVALCNTSFMRQLVTYARDIRMLDPDPNRVAVPKYGRELDRRRILSSHLPQDFY